jgi:hypothetical protein
LILTSNFSSCFESKFFRVSPAEINFNKWSNKPEDPKYIVIESTCNQELFVESICSPASLVSAVQSVGKIAPGGVREIRVNLKEKAFQGAVFEPMFVHVMINNSQINIPIRFINE